MALEVYNVAQTFYVDPDTVKGAASVGISSIDLFFKKKPNPATNKSSLVEPGVVLFLVETTPEKIPVISDFSSGLINNTCYVEYSMIATSTDASRATKFKFDKPILVETGKEYALVVKFDGNDDFELWTSKQGDLLVGTNKVSPGASGKFVGNYYTSTYITPNSNTATTTWKPISDTDLKFKIYVARYTVNGIPVSNATVSATLGANVPIYGTGTGTANITYNGNTVTFQISTNHYEYIKYDKKNSKPDVKGGEWVYQNTVFYPGGSATGVTVAVQRGSTLITANTQLPNGQLFNWNSIYAAAEHPEYIVIVSLNDSTAGERRTDIRKVVSVDSNTVLRVSEGMNFTNSVAYFIKSPVAQVSRLENRHHHDRTHNNFRRGFEKRRKVKSDFLELNQSNANATHRFVNNCINSISVAVGAGGSSYSNSDYITINGYEDIACAVVSGYPARANLVTNSSGGITAVYLSNVGCGFVNTALIAGSNIVYSNSAGGTSSGSSATLTFTTGAVLRAEFDGADRTGGYFVDCEVVNHEISHMIPHVDVHHPAGVTHDHYYSHGHHCIVADTWLGVKYFCYHSDWAKFRKQTQPYYHNAMPHPYIPVMVSRSNEFVIVDPSTCNPNTSGGGSGNVEVVAVSNNDFICVQPGNVAITYSRFKINNDYFGENTNSGNAEAKYITKKINFANERFAEDLVCYITAYRPLNTDVKIFARIHNSKDPEAFDDKDWTMLEIKEGDIYSSSADANSYIEMQFGFQKTPNVALALTGSGTIENTSVTNVIGVGTTFSTNAYANLQVNDVVRISNKLFPNNYLVSVVTAIDSDAQFRISRSIADSYVTGVTPDVSWDGNTALQIDLIGRVGNSTVNALGYPMQTFNHYAAANIATYYNSSLVEFRTYDSMQLKIVLLSDIAQVNSVSANVIPTTVPRVDDIRVIGVTT
jgi:hypothetical protein